MRIKICLAILFGIFFISLVSAIPSPHAFYGTVSDSNENVVDGGLITAEINGIEVASANIIDGSYDLTVESEYGGVIYFYFLMTENPIANYTFDSFEVTELDFIIQVPSLPEEDDDDQTSSGHTSDIEQTCKPSWDCSSWGSCNSGIMQRSCYDRNHCPYSYNKPNEVAGCGISEKVFVEEDYTSVVLIGGVLTIVLLGILIGVLARR